MTADAANRSDVRTALGTLLRNSLVPAYVDEVLDYPSEPLTKKRIILLASGGSSRQTRGVNDTRWENVFTIQCFTFVKDADTAQGWTEQNVEDTLDLIDKKIADVIADNRASSNWSNIGFAREPDGKPEDSEIVSDTTRKYKLEARNIFIRYVEG